jgi:hypothetical protein
MGFGKKPPNPVGFGKIGVDLGFGDLEKNFPNPVGFGKKTSKTLGIWKKTLQIGIWKKTLQIPPNFSRTTVTRITVGEDF